MATRVRLCMIHPVQDFDRYKDVAMEAVGRNSPGLLGRTIFRAVDDPNEVMVELAFDSADNARAMIPSLNLREIYDRAGVDVYPAIFIGEEVEELGYGVT